MEFKRGERVGICIQRHTARVVGGSANAQYSWYVQFVWSSKSEMMIESWV